MNLGVSPETDRRQDWPARLDAYLRDCAARPFQYGAHDCALFAAGAVAAVTGWDPAAAWRGAYDSLSSGQQALRAALGRVSLPQAVNRYLGRPHKLWRQAGRGDIAWVQDLLIDSRVLGVVDLSGERVAVAGAEGMIFAPTHAIRLVWKI